MAAVTGTPEYPNNYQGIYIVKGIFSAAILLIRIMDFSRNSVVLLLLTKPVKPGVAWVCEPYDVCRISGSGRSGEG
jgi:hypothetical protein